MTDSFADRIASAESERQRAKTARDKHYPGSPAWEAENRVVLQWERTILDLREQAGG